MSSSGGEGEARRLFDGAYTAGEIFLTSTTLRLKAKAKRPSLPRESRDKRDHRKRRSERARTEAVGTSMWCFVRLRFDRP